MPVQDVLRRIKHLQFNSALGRELLGLFYHSGNNYRLLFGQLKGYRLYYEPAVNFHAILGLWDHDMLEVMKVVFERSGLASETITIADVGANIGYISLWFSHI